ERTLVTRKFPNMFVSVGVVRIAWSPDGKIVACPVMVSGGGAKRPDYSVVGVSVKDGSEKELTSHRWESVDQVAWLSNSSLAVLAGDEATSRQLWRIPFPGGEAHRLTNDSNWYAGISKARDSGTLVTVVRNGISNIQIAAKGDLGHAKQITSGIADGIGGLSWTPDGRIVYVSLASNKLDIWIMNADGSNQRQLTYDGWNYNPSVSSDGRYIVYDSIQADKRNIWRMNVDGSNSKQLTDGILD